jgi:hypothetical protein
LSPREGYFWAALTGILLFFVPLVLFTNLHIVHNYYQSANALFLVGAAAIILAGLARKGHVEIAAGLCALVLITQFIHFSTEFWPLARESTRNQPLYQAAQFIRSNAPQGKALVVLGIDWNPIVHYYSERKGLAVPGWAPSADILKTALTDPSAMGGLEVGSVLACSPLLDNRPDLKLVALDFIKGIEQQALTTKRFGDCIAYVLK